MSVVIIIIYRERGRKKIVSFWHIDGSFHYNEIIFLPPKAAPECAT